MYRAVLVSLVLHLAFVISPEALLPAQRGDSSASRRGELRMVLSQAPTSQEGVVASMDQHVVAEKKVSRRELRTPLSRGRIGAASVLPDKSLSTVAIQPSSKVVVRDRTQDDEAQSISEESERTYRLNLAREARKFKSYLPRDRAWQVSIVISFPLSSVWPEVALQHSSGVEDIDRQVLAMMAQAVRMAEVPMGLRGRGFQIVVPIEYRLTD